MAIVTWSLRISCDRTFLLVPVLSRKSKVEFKLANILTLCFVSSLRNNFHDGLYLCFICRYLYSRGVEVSTVDSLQRLRGQNNIDAELKEMHLEMEAERGLQVCTHVVSHHVLALQFAKIVRLSYSMVLTCYRYVLTFQNMGYIELLRTPYLRRALGIGAVLHMGQQMSGMNALIIYSADVFASSSLQAPDTDLVCNNEFAVVRYYSD